MQLMPSIPIFSAGQRPASGGERQSEPPAAETASEQPPFPSTALAGIAERRLAWAVVLVSTGIFFALLPFARQPLTPLWAFIPVYEAAL
jgi:hypothetical protein